MENMKRYCFLTLLVALTAEAAITQTSTTEHLPVTKLSISDYAPLENQFKVGRVNTVVPSEGEKLWRYKYRAEFLGTVYAVDKISCQPAGKMYGAVYLDGGWVRGEITADCSTWIQTTNYGFHSDGRVTTSKEAFNFNQADINAWLTINGRRIPPGTLITNTSGKIWIEGITSWRDLPRPGGPVYSYDSYYKFDFLGSEQSMSPTSITYYLNYPAQINITEKGRNYELLVRGEVNIDGVTSINNPVVNLSIQHDNCGMGADQTKYRLGVWRQDGIEIQPTDILQFQREFVSNVRVDRAPFGVHECEIRLNAEFP
ncbi:TPA: hypothetical protein J1Y30_003536 [Escherichia coli]|nr:hypothetical protein [Escherichia coli]HBA7462186.1 hypothetical protein [Escherichia coli]HBA7589812.1 hypothetical protein [Escherichia coli]